MRKQIHPAIERLGLRSEFGWHTFRHSYSTLLRTLGTDIKVQQNLFRHSSARLTLDTYTQAVTPAKRGLKTLSCNSCCRLNQKQSLHLQQQTEI
jgi:integrase